MADLGLSRVSAQAENRVRIQLISTHMLGGQTKARGPGQRKTETAAVFYSRVDHHLPFELTTCSLPHAGVALPNPLRTASPTTALHRSRLVPRFGS
jgi:hypothetical protein